MRKRWMVGVGLIVVTIYALWAIFGTKVAAYLLKGISNDSITTVAQWGDSFGVFNALVSVAGFSILLVTLAQQQQATKDQAEDLHRQRFESSFFELLKLMRELREGIYFSYSREYVNEKTDGLDIEAMISRQKGLQKRHESVDAFSTAIKEMHFWLTQEGVATNTSRDQLVSIYMRRIHSRIETVLGPYFRIVYTILKRISEDKILNHEEKVRYGNLLRSQLTTPEITLLAVNGISPIAKDLHELLSEFRMLKYLASDAWRRRLSGIYGQEAFSGRDELN